MKALLTFNVSQKTILETTSLASKLKTLTMEIIPQLGRTGKVRSFEKLKNHNYLNEQ